MIGVRTNAPNLSTLLNKTEHMSFDEKMFYTTSQLEDFLRIINSGSGSTIHKTANDLYLLRSFIEIYFSSKDDGVKKEAKTEYNETLYDIFRRREMV